MIYHKVLQITEVFLSLDPEDQPQMQSKLFGAVGVILSIYIIVIIFPSNCRLHMLYPIYPMKVVLVIPLYLSFYIIGNHRSATWIIL